MIPFDTLDMQSMTENNVLIEEYDLQMTLNYKKTQHNILASLANIIFRLSDPVCLELCGYIIYNAYTYTVSIGPCMYFHHTILNPRDSIS